MMVAPCPFCNAKAESMECVPGMYVVRHEKWCYLYRVHKYIFKDEVEMWSRRGKDGRPDNV